MSDLARSIVATLEERFGETFKVDETLSGLPELLSQAVHRTHRRYLPRAVDAAS